MRILAGALALLIWAGPGAANQKAVTAINALRASASLPGLSYSPRLEKTAERHATDMLHKGFFSHKGSNGSTVGKRAKRAGYRWCLISENIAKGQNSLGEVMKDWRTSPPHYKNMMRKGIREFAVAQVGDVWVMVLGARKC